MVSDEHQTVGIKPKLLLPSKAPLWIFLSPSLLLFAGGLRKSNYTVLAIGTTLGRLRHSGCPSLV